MAKLSGMELDLEEDGAGGQQGADAPPSFQDFFTCIDNLRPDRESESDSGSGWFSDSDGFPDSSSFFFDREYVESAFDLGHSRGVRAVDNGSGPNPVPPPAFEFSFWGFEDEEEEEEEEGLGFGFPVSSGTDPQAVDSGGGGLRVAGSDSDSDCEDEVFNLNSNENGDGRAETGLPTVWDSFLGEEDVAEGEILEWEEVQNAINVTHDSVTVLAEELPALSGLSSSHEDDHGSLHEHDLDWEVLLAVNNVVDYIEQAEAIGVSVEDDTDPDYYHFLASHYDNEIDYGDYDAIFGRMFDNESGNWGSPPAAAKIVKDLPVVEFTIEELNKGNIACAVCKEEIIVEEKVRKLPCQHCYHEECIVPWLEIRNTCPVCRFELPTDDAEYERKRTRQRTYAR